MLRPLLLSTCVVAGLAAMGQDRCTTHHITERWLQAHGQSTDLRSAVMHAPRGDARGGGPLHIPVAVHVVYNNTAENVSDAVIYAMLEQMNADYQGTNSDFNEVRAPFVNARGVANINFCLATVDPGGNATNGITRTSTTETWFDPDHETDEMKSAPLGHAAWDPSRYLNIWICDISSGATGGLVTAGYAYLPYGGVVGSSIDGLVVDYIYGVGSGSDGRTATHEVGHYLGLLHPWGEGTCSNGDGIGDTPNTDEPTFSCANASLMQCTGVLTQYENFMDYADCSMMFTDDQVSLMLGTLTGVRSGLLTSTACTGTTGPCTITSLNGTSDGDFIDGVVLEDINNTGSGAGAAYQDLTTTYTTALARGGTYSLFITGGTYFPDHYAAWIDLDGDGTYEDNEKVGEFASFSAGQTGQFDFIMPANATLGATTMRVRGVFNTNDENAVTDPCFAYEYGETEDYGIVVTSTGGCIPVAGVGTDDGDFIDGVVLGGIINVGSGEVGGPDYTDYTEVLGTALALGETYTIYITGGTYAPDHYAAWIDYNADGTYALSEKLGEFVTTAPGQTNQFVFAVPLGATLGTTTLRVRGVYNGDDGTAVTDPCTDYNYGETEDYRIDIVGSGGSDCIPTSASGTTDGDYINGVQLGGIVNTNSGSTGGPSYTDYTGQFGTALSVNTSYTLTVTGGDYAPDHYAAWIDYNGDGAFGSTEKLGEFVTTTTQQTSTINFTVPASATLGTTVMRVRGVYTGTDATMQVDPCFSYLFGETEDYRIVLTSNGSGSCEPFSLQGPSDGDFVDGVVLEDISNTGTGAEDGPSYTDYSSAHSTALSRSSSYSVSITGGTYNTDHYAAWIDYDHDNAFETTEKLGEFITTAPGQTQSIAFTVPNNATLGATVMRIRGAYPLTEELSPLTPCYEYVYSETEDYGITIELSTGIAANEGLQLGVVRNGDQAIITWTRTGKDQRLTVIDAAGRVVTDARPNSNTFSFPMGGLATGIYQVVVLTDGQRLVGQLPKVMGE